MKLAGYFKNAISYLHRNNTHEIQSLNGLRALSLFLIFGVHTWGSFIPVVSAEILSSPQETIIMNLTSGVDLFLLLSGFLISLGLKRNFAKREISFSLFFKKRMLRIFPAYYFFLFYSLIIFYYYKVPFSSKGMLIDALYLSNYLHGQLPHTWSLALEEQFYLFFPFFAHFVLFRLKRNQRLMLLTALYLLPLAARYIIFAADPGMDYVTYSVKMYKPAHTRMDSIFAGILLMEIYTERKELLQRMTGGFMALVTGCAAALLLFHGHTEPHTGGTLLQSVFRYNLVNGGYALLFLLALGSNPWQKLLALPVFRPAARLSYTMYLWHFILGGIAARFVPGLRLLPFSWGMYLYAWFALFFLILLLAVVPFALIEYPFLRKKEHLST